MGCKRRPKGRVRARGEPQTSVFVHQVLDLVGQLLDAVLGLAARLVDLALVLEVLVAGQVAGCLLDAALGLVGIVRCICHRFPLSLWLWLESSYPTRNPLNRWRPASAC